RAGAGGGLARPVARGAAHLRLLRLDRRDGAHRQDRPVGRRRQAGRDRGLPRRVVGRPGRGGPSLRNHRVRRRTLFSGRPPGPGPAVHGGRGPRVARSGRQVDVIKINLAPPSPTLRGEVDPRIHLGLVFGGLTAIFVLLLGGYAWMLSADVRELHRDIDQTQAEIARL